MSSYVQIDYHWAEPDPEIVAQQMLSIANQLDDLIEPMTIAGELARTDVQENFDTETDPSGAAWQPWSDNYEPYALAFGSGQILNLTGALKSAAASPSAFVPTNEGLFINTGGFPEYWAWNNFGSYDRMTKNVGEDVFGVIGGQQNVLPERPFLGLSPEARVKIEAAFALWFEGSIALGSSKAGKAMGRHSLRYPKGTPGGLGGRFMPRGS